MRIRDLHARAGRPAISPRQISPRQLVPGVFVTVADVIDCAKPSDGGDLAALAEALKRQEHCVKQRSELYALAGELMRTAHRSRMARQLSEERHRRLIGVSAEPVDFDAWELIAAEAEAPPCREIPAGLMGL
jgi:hypothetical protein